MKALFTRILSIRKEKRKEKGKERGHEAMGRKAVRHSRILGS
jgi:hypothetical protein